VISLRLAARALRLTLARSHADPTPDYDLASEDYDAFFTRVMGRHSRWMLGYVDIRPGDAVIELACGTGFLSTDVARRLDGRGSIRAVDKSAGMLRVAREQLAQFEALDVKLEQGDMLEFLRAQDTASADIVICGWAICYSNPVALLREVSRVLRPGGQVAIIETRADALSAMVEALERLFSSDPSLMKSLIRVALPKNAGALRQWLLKAGLTPTVLREGVQTLPCTTPDAALEWVERSGAAAGFRDAVDQSREHEVRSRLNQELERHVARRGSLALNHSFVIGIGRVPPAVIANAV
jgi:ubiquinone/menaquinone biosynthesis C-methylase UbiE